jgi:hypothetical protein
MLARSHVLILKFLLLENFTNNDLKGGESVQGKMPLFPNQHSPPGTLTTYDLATDYTASRLAGVEISHINSPLNSRPF